MICLVYLTCGHDWLDHCTVQMADFHAISPMDNTVVWGFISFEYGIVSIVKFTIMFRFMLLFLTKFYLLLTWCLAIYKYLFYLPAAYLSLVNQRSCQVHILVYIAVILCITVIHFLWLTWKSLTQSLVHFNDRPEMLMCSQAAWQRFFCFAFRWIVVSTRTFFKFLNQYACCTYVYTTLNSFTSLQLVFRSEISLLDEHSLM